MKHSLTYYITLLVIKLKGLKKNFSEDPIDYLKIRKEDVHEPKGRFFKENQLRKFNISNSTITEIGQNKNSEQLVIFLHGGAFISGPTEHHWNALMEIAKQTQFKVWMCDYPKAPENHISAISENIDSIYETALSSYKSENIFLIGDSVGGTLVTTLTQRLIKNKIDLPRKVILICPVMDASMSNPEIKLIDASDPILSRKGVLSAKKMCAGTTDLKNELISPLYGSFDKFPETIIFIAENDITLPDQKKVVQKMKETKIKFEIVVGEDMPHIWPFLPVMKEAKTALNDIIQYLKK
ncbi:alpha/beta hydrolase fold domain-containing protein [Brumimicrobium mesophilum]|uniref:alpha/beta hydrolase fold domain-containing protein n=1 Tax=Brumimicrobium mesophilum TaxID=392717 RepID=UPI0018FE8B63|nr:alpha/beta hydrolase [Brumimicrobium mesophilum]